MTEKEILLRKQKSKIIDLLTLAVLRKDTQYVEACDAELKKILKELDKETGRKKK